MSDIRMVVKPTAAAGIRTRLTPDRKSDIKAPDPIVDSGGRAVKAVLFHEFGGLDVLQVEEVDDPQPGAGEVLIEITASALNHLDVDIREGVSRFDVSRRSSSVSSRSGGSPRSARASAAGRSATA
jgi:hypothetical protein